MKNFQIFGRREFSFYIFYNLHFVDFERKTQNSKHKLRFRIVNYLILEVVFTNVNTAFGNVDLQVYKTKFINMQ